MEREDSFLMPINVGHECQILMHNSEQLGKCQAEAFDYWVRPWQKVQRNSMGDLPNLPSKTACCYRWSLLDCLADSVAESCPDAETFDMRAFVSKRDHLVVFYESFECAEYPFGALACHLSTWAVVLLVLGALLFLGLIGLLVILNVRAHSQSRHVKSRDVTDL